MTMNDSKGVSSVGRSGGLNLPAFPDDIDTAPLLRISLRKLLSRDAQEIQRFIQACQDVGFFYLHLQGPGDTILDQSERLFDVGEELFDLPIDEKTKYNFEHLETYFGYKRMGATATDKSGTLDRNEFYNASLRMR